VIPAGARTVRVPPERLSRWLDGFANRHGALSVDVDVDVVLVQGEDDAQAWLHVPFGPLVLDQTGPLASLVVHANRVRRVGVLLVRRGGCAVGVFDGIELIASKVDSSYVQGTTKAGGWSQQRYARRRANQSRAAFADAADIAARIVLPAVAGLDAVIVGGDRAAVDTVLADARLAPLRALIVEPFLAVPDPRLKVLQSSPELFRALRIQLLP
jgi:hypothetical protein